MQKMTYTVTIAAPKKQVWETMTGAATYNDWAKAFSEGSVYKGTWKQGEIIDFFDPGRGGTRATLELLEAHERILLKHTAVLSAELQETEPDAAGEKWIGSTEEYLFAERLRALSSPSTSSLTKRSPPCLIMAGPKHSPSSKRCVKNKQKNCGLVPQNLFHRLASS